MLIAALSVARRYRNYTSRRISEQESIIALLKYAEGRIKRYLMMPRDAFSGFADKNLGRIGFFEEIKNCVDMAEVFEKISDRLSVGTEAMDVLGKLFSQMGKGYKEEVVAGIGEAVEKLEKILEEEKNELPGNEKVVTAVLSAGVLGVFIMLV